MRDRPTALGWVDISQSYEIAADRQEIVELANHLGYQLIWASEFSLISVFDMARQADVDAVVVCRSHHLDAGTRAALRTIVDVEVAMPRQSHARLPITSIGMRGV